MAKTMEFFPQFARDIFPRFAQFIASKNETVRKPKKKLDKIQNFLMYSNELIPCIVTSVNLKYHDHSRRLYGDVIFIAYWTFSDDLWVINWKMNKENKYNENMI